MGLFSPHSLVFFFFFSLCFFFFFFVSLMTLETLYLVLTHWKDGVTHILLLNYKALVRCGWKSPALPVSFCSHFSHSRLSLDSLLILDYHLKHLLSCCSCFWFEYLSWESLSKCGTKVTLIACQILCPFFFAHGMK